MAASPQGSITEKVYRSSRRHHFVGFEILYVWQSEWTVNPSQRSAPSAPSRPDRSMKSVSATGYRDLPIPPAPILRRRPRVGAYVLGWREDHVLNPKLRNLWGCLTLRSGRCCALICRDYTSPEKRTYELCITDVVGRHTTQRDSIYAPRWVCRAYKQCMKKICLSWEVHTRQADC